MNLVSRLKLLAWIGIFLITLPLSNYLSSRDTDIPANLSYLENVYQITTGFPFSTFTFYPCSACDANVTREALLGLGGNILFWLMITGLLVALLPERFLQRKYVNKYFLIGTLLSLIYVIDILFWINN